MEMGTLKESLKKYRYGAAVLVLGLMIMAIPHPEETEAPLPEKTAVSVESLEDSLSRLLSRLEGAGKVQVLLTQRQGAETVYQTDDDLSADGRNYDTVVITGSDRSESGLVRQVNPPQYLGAVVLSQGADSANVRLALVQAVRSATGLSTDRITVLKMK